MLALAGGMGENPSVCTRMMMIMILGCKRFWRVMVLLENLRKLKPNLRKPKPNLRRRNSMQNSPETIQQNPTSMNTRYQIFPISKFLGPIPLSKSSVSMKATSNRIPNTPKPFTTQNPNLIAKMNLQLSGTATGIRSSLEDLNPKTQP
jgi:hypothetical protein